MTEKRRQSLEDRREVLMNSFGWSRFQDGLIQEAIDKINEQLATQK